METLLSWAQGPLLVSVAEASGRAVDGQLAPDPSAFPRGCPAAVGGALPMGSPAGHPRPLLQSQPKRGAGAYRRELCRWGRRVGVGSQAPEEALAVGCPGQGEQGSHPAPSASQPRQELRAGGWGLSVPRALSGGRGPRDPVPPAAWFSRLPGRSSGTGPPAPVESRQVTWVSRLTAVSLEEVGPCRGF